MTLIAALVLMPWNGFLPDPRFPYLSPALNLAYREGVLVSYPDVEPSGRRRLPSRYEYAVFVHALVQSQIALAERALRTPGNDIQRASMLRCTALLPAYARAGREFSKELAALGITDDFGQARLADLMRQVFATSPSRACLFRDVRAEHWAAKAVGDMRTLGMLDGYLDDRFRGSR